MKQLFKEYFRQIFLVFPLILVITALLISHFSPAEAAILTASHVFGILISAAVYGVIFFKSAETSIKTGLCFILFLILWGVFCTIVINFLVLTL